MRKLPAEAPPLPRILPEPIASQDQASLRRPQFRRRRHDHPDPHQHAEVLRRRRAGAARISGDGDCDRALARRVERSPDGLDLRSHAYAPWPSPSLYVDRRSAVRRGIFLPAESAGVTTPVARAAIWFGVTFILYFIFHTIYVLPHYALGPELTQNYQRALDACSRGASRSPSSARSSPPRAPGIMMKALHLTERQVFFRLGIFFGVLLTVLYVVAGGDDKGAARFRRARIQSAGARRPARAAQPPIWNSARQLRRRRASPARFRPR